MITLAKLQTLGTKTRLRKAVLILQQTEQALLAGTPVDTDYLRGLLEIIRSSVHRSEEVPEACAALERLPAGSVDDPGYPRGVNTLRYVLQDYLGVSPGDWDFYQPGTARLDASRRNVMPLRVYLDDIRSPFNVGAIFRTADSFGVERITVSPFTASPEHPRAVRTSMGCTESVPWKKSPPEGLEDEAGVFALELGGVPLEEFAFPAAGTVIIGSEELGVSPEALAVADRGLGRVSVPLYGTKGSLNVSVAFGILLYAWRTSLERD